MAKSKTSSKTTTKKEYETPVVSEEVKETEAPEAVVEQPVKEEKKVEAKAEQPKNTIEPKKVVPVQAPAATSIKEETKKMKKVYIVNDCKIYSAPRDTADAVVGTAKAGSTYTVTNIYNNSSGTYYQIGHGKLVKDSEDVSLIG